MQDSLLPKIVETNSPGYTCVEELKEILNYANTPEGAQIRNVALTGPFGSGKSSILLTVQKECEGENKPNKSCLNKKKNNALKFLPISLARLNELKISDSNDDNGENAENSSKTEEEELNRKIEYSILQQLVYREKASTVPDSRIKRILTPDTGIARIATILAFFISLCILLEPNFIKVQSIYQLLNFGKWNVVGDIIAIIYVVVILCKYIIPYSLRTIHKITITHLNIQGTEIMMEKANSNSIFNHHLDEILYFFSRTNYNVIVIEDLDRFGTPDIFLKLRELSMLINESKIVDRHVTFLYAIKDDLFEDEERTKFFDQIVTVIPFINASNSHSKLKKLLKNNGLEDNLITDDALKDIAFFIQDMRILINIVNEFFQYRKMLCNNENHKLDMTKLLAMMVYKNYHPEDFAKLHRRDGRVFKALQLKNRFEKLIVSQFEKEKTELEQEERCLIDTRDKDVVDIRLCFIHKFVDAIACRTAFKIRIDGSYYSFIEIAQSEDLFDKLCKLTYLEYYYTQSNGYTTNSYHSFNNDRIKSLAQEFRLQLRLDSINGKSANILRQKRLNLEKKFASKTGKNLSFYLLNYPNLMEDPAWVSLSIPPMIALFLREGYIDENYYDYISFFFEGMITLDDKNWLLSLKLGKSQPFNYQLTQIRNICDELRPTYFESDTILNIDLLDFLYENRSSLPVFYNLFMNRLKHADVSVDFIIEYYKKGENVDSILVESIQWDEETSWIVAEEQGDSAKSEILKTIWCKYSKTMPDQTIEWMGVNFSFLVNNIDIIGRDRCIQIVSECIFDKLILCPDWLMDAIIKTSSYQITLDNISMLLIYLSNDIAKQVSFESILKSQNNDLIRFLTDAENIIETLRIIPEKSMEEENGIIYIIDNADIPTQQKEKYLQRQTAKINNISSISTDNYKLAFENSLVVSSWQNMIEYYRHYSFDTVLSSFINKHYQDISESHTTEEDEQLNIYIDIFLSNEISINGYKSLIENLNFQVDTNDIRLKDLHEDRFKCLLQNGILPFSTDVLQTLVSSLNLAYYLEFYIDQYVSILDNVAVNFTLPQALILINSKKLTRELKVKVFPKFDFNSIVIQSTILQDFGAHILINNPFHMEWPISYIRAIIYPNMNGDTANKIRLIVMKREPNLIRELLREMGFPYSELLEDRKCPEFVKSSYNADFLNFMIAQGVISSYKEDKNNPNKYRAYRSHK